MENIRSIGGYRETCSFQTSTLIYDAIVWFCEKFPDARSGTMDQMVQAARAGRQNIAKGSRAAAPASKTDLRLLNSARARFEELLLDYEDFLRHRRLAQWAPGSAEALAVRNVTRNFRDRSEPSNLTDLPDQERWALYSRWLEHADAAVRANALICLINQTNDLLDQQIAALEKQLIEGGGCSGQPAAARMAERSPRRDPSERSDFPDKTPACPKCGKPTVLRTAKSGKSAGKQFWGCTGYPDCKGIVNI